MGEKFQVPRKPTGKRKQQHTASKYMYLHVYICRSMQTGCARFSLRLFICHPVNFCTTMGVVFSMLLLLFNPDLLFLLDFTLLNALKRFFLHKSAASFLYIYI